MKNMPIIIKFLMSRVDRLYQRTLAILFLFEEYYRSINLVGTRTGYTRRVCIIDVQFPRCFIHEMSHADSLLVALDYARSMYYANTGIILDDYMFNNIRIIYLISSSLSLIIGLWTQLQLQNFFKGYNLFLSVSILYHFIINKIISSHGR